MEVWYCKSALTRSHNGNQFYMNIKSGYESLLIPQCLIYMGPAEHLMRDILPKKELSYGIQWYLCFPGSDCRECNLRNKWVSMVVVCLHPNRITALLSKQCFKLPYLQLCNMRLHRLSDFFLQCFFFTLYLHLFN